MEEPEEPVSDTHLSDVPDECLSHVLSFVPTVDIGTAAAFILGAASRSRHAEVCDAAVALRVSRSPWPLPPMQVGETPARIAAFIDRLVERRRNSIAAGVSHSVCLRLADHQPYSWGGKNTFASPVCTLHHLGHGHDVGPCVRAPARMLGLEYCAGLCECAAGEQHTLLLTVDGRVWSCGRQRQYRGAGGLNQIAVAREVEGELAEVCAVQVSAGEHSLILSSDGTIFAYGEAGIGHSASGGSIPSMAIRRVALASEPQLETAAASDASDTPSGESSDETRTATEYESASSDDGGPSHRVAPGSQRSRRGQRRLPPQPPRVVEISAGLNHSLAVGEDGELYAWGRNTFLQCGAPAETTAILQSYVRWPRRVSTPVRVRHVSAGRDHSLLTSFVGDLYSFGRGEGGRLGHNDEQRRACPTLVEGLPAPALQPSAGSDHSLVLLNRPRGALLAFGKGQYGQLGLQTRADRLVPIEVEALSSEAIREVAAGEHFSLVSLESGELYAFGLNAHGQLGLGTGQAMAMLPTRVDLPSASALQWESRAQWTVQSSFFIRGAAWMQQIRRPHMDEDEDGQD